MYARSFGDVFSPAALIVEHLFFTYCIRTSECPSSTRSCQYTFATTLCVVSNIRIERSWVHGHSGGVYLVPFRTQKSSPPASRPVLWYESPRERLSLCPSLFLGFPDFFSTRLVKTRFRFYIT